MVLLAQGPGVSPTYTHTHSHTRAANMLLDTHLHRAPQCEEVEVVCVEPLECTLTRLTRILPCLGVDDLVRVWVKHRAPPGCGQQGGKQRAESRGRKAEGGKQRAGGRGREVEGGRQRARQNASAFCCSKLRSAWFWVCWTGLHRYRASAVRVCWCIPAQSRRQWLHLVCAEAVSSAALTLL